MASAGTRSVLASGNFMGVISVLMQLRKVSTAAACSCYEHYMYYAHKLACGILLTCDNTGGVFVHI